ncbi:MAG: hypothetical protein IJV78_04920 [Clostridia bacterium]|nr:hypothetical protein [Clostridia bacterium]
MNNIIQIPHKKRLLLKAVISIIILFAIMVAVLFFTFSSIGKKNLNGQVMEVTGKLEYAPEDDDSLVKISGTLYAVSTSDNYYDISSLDGQLVTLIIPVEVHADANPWILGIKQGNKVLVDYNVVLEDHRKDNDLGSKISLALLIAMLLACIVISYFRSRIAATQDATLSQEFANYFSIKQPNCPQRKHINTLVIVWVILIVGVSILMATLATETFSDPINIVLVVAVGVVFIGGIVALALFASFVYKKEIEFYAQKFPFDFKDISHVKLKKSVKQQIIKSMEEESKLYPHRYGDGGNGFDVQFGEKGIDLYMLEEMSEEQRMMQTNETNDNNEVFDGVTPPDQFRFVMHLDYDQLNFKAVALVKKGEKPLMVIIQSQLDGALATEELQRDIHLLFDSNLLQTLTHFNVNVQGLAEILENKLAIMQQHCNKAKSHTYTPVEF